MNNCKLRRVAVAAITEGMDRTRLSEGLARSWEVTDGADENLTRVTTQSLVVDAEGVEF